MSEFDLIARLQSALGRGREDCVVGIGDDAAVVNADGTQLASAVDTMVEGVHFLAGTSAADLGWKALAVNLSDLAAMGATPQWALLALSGPQLSADWIDQFTAGWNALAEPHRVQLIGGDTCRGPALNISVTVIGRLGANALLRSGARVGDDVYLSGSVGDAAAGLALLQEKIPGAGSEAQRQALLMRLHRPRPRCALGIALAAQASAAIDVSDGLLADAGHLLRASGCAATLELDRLSESSALAAVVADDQQRRQFMLNGGDDYELLFCAAPAARDAIANIAAETATPVQRIGRVHEGTAGMLYADGQPLRAKGWDHFR